MKNCRICKKEAEVVVSFGRMPIANNFLREEDFSREPFFDLEVIFCNLCKSLQLAQQPEAHQMFHENYAFFSGTSQKMAEHFERMATNLFENFLQDREDPFVVELGSNDGIMLEHVAKRGVRHLGVEPSSNVALVAQNRGVNTLVEFFDEEIAKVILKRNGQADVIAAANVMNHIPDLGTVARGISLLLKKTGVLVFEDPYVGDVIKKVSYDQFYDEHIYMFSVESVQNIFEPWGFQVFRVQPQITHGGSMRYYLGFKGVYQVEPSVYKQLQKEKEQGLDRRDTYYSFALACEEKRNTLRRLLEQLKKEGKRVIGYAATAKSSTILNYSGIGAALVEYLTDITPLKQGKFSPGMHIPVVSPEVLKEDYPDYAILFAWNHADEIFEKESGFVKRGGKWITLVPRIEILR